jgi:hypothetical protein
LETPRARAASTDAERNADLHCAATEHHDQSNQQQQTRDRGERRDQEEHDVVNPAAEVARRNSEEESERDHDQARERPDQERDARPLQREVENVAAEHIGAEQVASGMGERRAAIELSIREGRRITLLAQGLRSENAVQHRAWLESGHRVLAHGPLSPADPRHRVEQRNHDEQGQHSQGNRPPLRQRFRRISPERIPADEESQYDTPENEGRHETVR